MAAVIRPRLWRWAVAIGFSVAALVGLAVLAATHSGSPASGVGALAAATSPSPSANGGQPKPFGRHGGRSALNHGGAVGTVTGVSGSTLTLRTLATDSLQVTTSPSTTYRKEQQTISFNDIHNGDVIAVRGTRSSDNKSIAATAITVRVPSLGGRVQSVNGDTITLVGPAGQLEYVTTSPATKYYSRGSAATSSAVTPGSFVTAEGTRTDLTHLSADDVVIRAPMGAGHHGANAAPAMGVPPAAGIDFAGPPDVDLT